MEGSKGSTLITTPEPRSTDNHGQRLLCAVCQMVVVQTPLLGGLARCPSCSFWQLAMEHAQQSLPEDKTIRSQGYYYQIDTSPSGELGPTMLVRWFDGRELATMRLRCVGWIPYSYQKVLHDNAIIAPFQGPVGVKKG